MEIFIAICFTGIGLIGGMFFIWKTQREKTAVSQTPPSKSQ